MVAIKKINGTPVGQPAGQTPSPAEQAQARWQRDQFAGLDAQQAAAERRAKEQAEQVPAIAAPAAQEAPAATVQEQVDAMLDELPQQQPAAPPAGPEATTVRDLRKAWADYLGVPVDAVPRQGVGVPMGMPYPAEQPAEPEPVPEPEVDYIFPAHVGPMTPAQVDGQPCWEVELHLRLGSTELAYMAQRLNGTTVGIKFKALGGGDGLAVL